MNYQYPALSPAYLGDLIAQGPFCLNTAIMLEILKEYELGSYLDVFPQRVPRKGFFLELKINESPNYLSQSDDLIKKWKNEIVVSIHDFEKLTFVCNVALRLGISDEIIELKKIFPEHKINARLQVLIDVAETRLQLDKSEKPSTEFLESYLNRNDLSLDDYVLIANRIIVKQYRYIGKSNLKDELKYLDAIKQFISEDQSKSQKSIYKRAFLMRGFAMSKYLPEQEVIELVNTSVNLISAVKTNTPFEEAIKKELLLTTIVTKAKTIKHFGQIEASSHLIKSLVEYDPLDSTVWSEQGLLLYKEDSWQEAFHSFQKAVSLGPPALALNAHFAGLSLIKLSRFEEALVWFEESSKFDPYAVSPLYEKAKLLSILGKKTESRFIVHQILGDQDLLSLLDESELECLKAL